MSTKEDIKEMLDSGATPEEVAEETGYSIHTIKTYQVMFDKENKPIKKEVEKVGKTQKEIVEEYMDKGFTPAKEIAEKTKIPSASVYTYMSMVRKDREEPKKDVEKAPEEKQPTPQENLMDPIREGLKAKLRKSDYRIKELDELYHKTRAEHKEVLKELNKATEDYKELAKEFTATQKRCYELEELLQEPAKCGCGDVSEELAQERKKHMKLFEYMMTVVEAQ